MIWYPGRMAAAWCYLDFGVRWGSWRCLWEAVEEFLLAFWEEIEA